MKNYKYRALFSVFFCVAILCFGSVSRVDATSIIELSGTSIPTLTVVDQGSDDALSHAFFEGWVKYNGSYGSFSNVSVTGKTVPFLGAGTYDDPEMFLGGSVSSQGAGTITLAFIHTDFDDTSPNNTFTGTFLTGNASVDFEYYLGIDNFSDGDWTNDELIGSTNFENLSFTGGTPPSGPYALTVVATITHTTGGITSFSTRLVDPVVVGAVPEPATVALLGIGIAGLCGGGYMRRRRNKNRK